MSHADPWRKDADGLASAYSKLSSEHKQQATLSLAICPHGELSGKCDYCEITEPLNDELTRLRARLEAAARTAP